MVSFLTDDSGDIYIDPQGQLVEIEGSDEIRQRIVNLFSTQKGSEIFNPEYGFDKVSMVRTPFVDDETSLHYYTMDALNPQNLYGITAVYNIKTEIITSGTERIGKINLEVQVSGEKTPVSINIGEL